MDNHAIAGLLAELADGLDFLDEPFKARAYRKAAETVAAVPMPLRELIADGRITDLAGVGTSIAALLRAWVIEQDFSALEQVRAQLPAGLSELLKVPGVGFKKLKILHERGVSTLEDLQAACDAGTLEGIKGFTPRHIARMRRAAADIMGYRGRFLLDTGLVQAEALEKTLREAGLRAEISGACRRGFETIAAIDIVVEESQSGSAAIDHIMGDPDIMTEDTLTYLRQGSPPVHVHIAAPQGFVPRLFLTTGSPAHCDRIKEIAKTKGFDIRTDGLLRHGKAEMLADEPALYARLGLPFIPPELRETDGTEFDLAIKDALPRLITPADIVGTIHNHTSYSDGKAPLKDLVAAAQELGYAWIGISDHSLSARYAGGMNLKAVKKQHAEIDVLNQQSGIAILKGVECDIQPDGSLDYPEAVLEGFDFIIASIHTQMDMEREAMTARIVQAIRHPRTSILGHPTGRLLLSRGAYAVDMDIVLEEALRNHVIIELNAHPWRLDLDWRRIASFTAAGGIISIGPDAHELKGLHDMRYGVLMARKGMLTPPQCLNTYAVDRAREVLQRCR